MRLLGNVYERDDALFEILAEKQQIAIDALQTNKSIQVEVRQYIYKNAWYTILIPDYL